jgi:hypothetical protein
MMALIPVVLEASNVPLESTLRFELCTHGASWRMSDGGLNTLGLSFNALASHSTQNANISSMRVQGSVLEIQAAASESSGVNSLTVTLFVNVPETAGELEGYCLLDEGVKVLAHFGLCNPIPVVWRDGPVTAVLPTMIANDLQSVQLTFNGICANQIINVELGAGLSSEDMRWSAIGGFAVSSIDNKPLALQCLEIEAHSILIVAASDDILTDSFGFTLNQLVVREKLSADTATSKMCLRAHYNDPISVTAQVGNLLPCRLQSTYTTFSF